MQWIHDQVKERTGKKDYAAISEISRAYRKICLITKFNWLRVSSQSLLRFTLGRSVYSLDMSRMRRLERIWVLNTTDEENWDLLEEAPPLLFERLVTDNRDLNGDDEKDTPRAYKIEGGTMATLTVTPTPDAAYTARVDYIEHVRELTMDDEPRLSESYDDTIAELAAAYVLERETDKAQLALGMKYEQRAMAEFGNIVADSHPNRTLDIDRVPMTWLK